MSDQAQRVLDALIGFYNENLGYPILTIHDFFDDKNSTLVDEDYEALTIGEEKQVIKAFLERAY